MTPKDGAVKVLSRKEFDALWSYIGSCAPRTAPELLPKKFPNIYSKTLWSIHNLHYQNKMKRNVALLKNQTKFEQRVYTRLFEELKAGNKKALLAIADSLDVAPSLVAKRVLESHYEGTAMTSCAGKNPGQAAAPNNEPTALSVLYELAVAHKISADWLPANKSGPDHTPCFTAQLLLDGATYQGTGSSLKEARHNAAREALTLVPYAVSEPLRRKITEVLEDQPVKESLPADLETETVDETFSGDTSDERLAEDTASAAQTAPSPDQPLIGKKTISYWMREPHRIPDPVLAQQVLLCVTSDVCYGPIQDAIRKSIGSEYEYKLLNEIKSRGLKYKDENQLRLGGYDKTPDFKLDLPIAVNGHIVNWIESKAAFGDDTSHSRNLGDQLWSYWNRFGPGLVIYWFGYVDDLEDTSDKGILVMDRFPENIITMDPSSDDLT